MKFADIKWAMITGATSDLGKALAFELAGKGISLILTAPRLDSLLSLKAMLPANSNIEIHPADLSHPADRQILIQQINALSPELLINNAGKGLYGPVLMHSKQENLTILEINASALLELSLEMGKMLQSRKKKGVVLNISSLASFFPYPYFSVYAASKSFVTSFSKAFDAEMKPFGIRILCSCPGQIDTAFRLKASKFFYNEKTLLTLPVKKVVRILLKQIEKEKPLSIIDWRYRLILSFSKILPSSLLNLFLKKSIGKRVPSI